MQFGRQRRRRHDGGERRQRPAPASRSSSASRRTCPRTGPTTTSPMEEGAQFAIDQINASGGVLGRQLELKTIDMRNDVAEGAKVTQQLIDEGAVYLIGTVGDGILAEGSVACAAGRPHLDRPRHRPVARRRHGLVRVSVGDERQHPGRRPRRVRRRQGYQTAYTLGPARSPTRRTCRVYFTDAFEHARRHGRRVRRVQDRRRRLLGGGHEAAERRPDTGRGVHADVHPGQHRVPPSAPAGRPHDAGALDRRERRRRPAGRRREGDRRPDVHELGVYRRG